MNVEQQMTLTRPIPVQVCEDVDDNTNCCPICFDLFKDINTIPIELGCSHKFCRECFENHFAVCIQQRKDVECPMCRGLICKNFSPIIVTVTTPPTITTIAQPVQNREDLCFTRTLVLAPMVSIIIIVIILVIWASIENKL